MEIITVAARLGDVLYWAGSIVASLCLFAIVGITITAALNGNDPVGAAIVTSFYLVPIAAISFGAGRACRYVLAGK